MNWMPIDSAPRGKARILLANAHGVWMGDFRPAYQSGYRPASPWSSAMLNHDHVPSEHRCKLPTHWMPLPPPPEAES